jgi:hypothetical protein
MMSGLGLLLLLAGRVSAQVTVPGPDLANLADGAARAVGAQNGPGLVAGAPQIVIQLPGVEPSGPVARPQAAALLKGFFQGTAEEGTRVRSAREVSAGRGLVELVRRYRTRGTQTVREQAILLGYRLEDGGWRLVELRIER